MRTLTLEDAYAEATTGPLEVCERASLWGEPDPGDGHVANCSHAAIDPEYRVKPRQLINAALLAHAFNVLPELVAALTSSIACIEASYCEVDDDTKESMNADVARYREVLAKASKVEVPE